MRFNLYKQTFATLKYGEIGNRKIHTMCVGEEEIWEGGEVERVERGDRGAERVERWRGWRGWRGEIEGGEGGE